jgi:hypothetical protein
MYEMTKSNLFIINSRAVEAEEAILAAQVKVKRLMDVFEDCEVIIADEDDNTAWMYAFLADHNLNHARRFLGDALAAAENCARTP